MLPDRAAFLSSRIFWAITLVFCAIEAAILASAYDHGADEDRLATQLALTHQASGVAWRLASTSIAAEVDPQLAWLESILFGLSHGGPVHTLDNSLVQLGAIKPPDARHVLTDAVARLGSARRLHNVVPGSPLVQDEIRGLVPALAQLGTVLASRRDEADHTAAVLVGIALVTTAGGFIAAGLLLLRQSRRLERSGRLMRSMMNQIGAGVCIIGSTDKIADANRAACRMLGRPRRELRGKRIEDILTEKEGVWVGERPDGMPLAIERIPGTIESERGPMRIFTLLDVTARHLTTECLQHLANHDPLTGLPNRGYLEGRFKEELARCRKDGVILGVAALDLDGFKPVNDTYGHAVGDALLVQIAQRLSAALRISDVIARVGGDEFIGLFPDVGNRDSLSFLGERLLGVFDEPFEVMGHVVSLSGSIGLVVAPADGEDQDSLLKAADEAMYRAKQAGKRRVQLSAVSPGRAA